MAKAVRAVGAGVNAPSGRKLDGEKARGEDGHSMEELNPQIYDASGGAPGGYGQGPGGGGYGPPPGGYAPPPGGYPPPGGHGPPPAGGNWGQPPPPMGGGQPAAWGGAAPAPGAVVQNVDVAELQRKVDRWFALSIASLFLGCGILGIIPIIKANSAKDAMHRQDYARAAGDIGTAKLLCVIGFVAFGLILSFYTVFFVVLRLAFL